MVDIHERFPPDGPEDKIRPNNGPNPLVTKGGLTYDEGMTLLRAFSSSGNAGALLMLRANGTYDYVARTGQPCVGWLRVYGKGNLKNGYWPGDLVDARNLFPDGIPVALMFALRVQVTSVTTPIVEEGFLSPTVSPWRSILKSFEIIKNNNLYHTLWTDLDIEPTALVSLFRAVRRAPDYAKKFIDIREKYPNLDPKIAFIVAVTLCNSYDGKPEVGINTSNSHMFGGAPDYKRVFNSDPIDWTGGKFKDRYAYNRPEVDFPFGKNHTRINEKFTEQAWIDKVKELVA